MWKAKKNSHYNTFCTRLRHFFFIHSTLNSLELESWNTCWGDSEKTKYSLNISCLTWSAFLLCTHARTHDYTSSLVLQENVCDDSSVSIICSCLSVYLLVSLSFFLSIHWFDFQLFYSHFTYFQKFTSSITRFRFRSIPSSPSKFVYS